jgi:hypothetical protein
MRVLSGFALWNSIAVAGEQQPFSFAANSTLHRADVVENTHTLFFSSLNCDGTSRYASCVHMLSDVVAGTRLEDNTIVAELQTQFDSSAATVQLWSYLANFILM